MIDRTFFSLLTWSICFSLIIAFFFKHLRAKGSLSFPSNLCLTSLTLPKVPVPNVDNIWKSFSHRIPALYLSFLYWISSWVSLLCTIEWSISKLALMLTFWIVNSVFLLFLDFLFLCWLLHDSSFQLSFLLLKCQWLLTGTWWRNRLAVLIVVGSFMTEHGLVVLVTLLRLILLVVPVSAYVRCFRHYRTSGIQLNFKLRLT